MTPTLRRSALILGICTVLAAGIWLLNKPGQSRASIVFFHVWSGWKEVPAEKALAEFAQKNPDIEIQSQVVNPLWANPYLFDAARNGYLPDVLTLRTSWQDNLDPEKNLLDLTPYINADNIDLETLISKEELDGTKINNKLYLIPFSARSTSALLYINETLATQAGLNAEALGLKTWDEFIALSKILVDRLNPPGQLEIVAWNPLLERGIPTFAILAQSLGIETQSADGTQALIGQPTMFPVWQAIDRYITEVYGSRGGARALLLWRNRYGGFATSSAYLPFAHGRCVFSISGSWAFGNHASASPQLQQAVRPVPGFSRPIPLYRSHAWRIGISKKTTNPHAAWRLLRFLTLEQAGNQRLNLEYALQPAITKYQSSEHLTRLFGQRWQEIAPYLKNQNAPTIDFKADYISPLYLTFITQRASGQSLEKTVARLQSEMQGYLQAELAPIPGAK